MRAVIQRVNRAAVKANNEIVGQIGKGLLVLLAVHTDDKEYAIAKMAEKIVNLRIFSDDAGKMNLSVNEIKGEVLVVSQFTLYGDASKGNRPSFIKSAKPGKAEEYYLKVIEQIKGRGIEVESGVFGAMMEVELINDGPVTIIMDL